MRWCVLVGLAFATVAYFLPREEYVLTLTEGDRGIVDEATELRLVRFLIPTYPSGKPRQYVSEVRVSSDGGETWRDAEISVNHPLQLNGWWIYQSSYLADGAGRLTTVLECVRERWFPLAVAGWVVVLLGALGIVWRGRRKDARLETRGIRTAFRFVSALLTIAVPVFIIGRAVLRPEPVPALQSPLMAPHVAAYAASYIILLFATFGIGRRLMPLGYFLMTAGLILGAWWGKLVWGAWWQCDPKETWSLATWLVYTGYFFFRGRPKAELALRILGAVFILLTLTWVNYSRLFSGLHTYA